MSGLSKRVSRDLVGLGVGDTVRVAWPDRASLAWGIEAGTEGVIVLISSLGYVFLDILSTVPFLPSELELL